MDGHKLFTYKEICKNASLVPEKDRINSNISCRKKVFSTMVKLIFLFKVFWTLAIPLLRYLKLLVLNRENP